jgi:predicted Rossmann fold nucleotide-binding protein DprA/Smf involved in DNA uptake
VQDILSEFECFVGLAGTLSEENPSSSEEKPKKAIRSNSPFFARHGGGIFHHLMSEHELAVFGCMSSQEQHVDELIRASKLPSSAVQSALFGLELKKQVEQLPGKFYRKKMK